MRDFLRYARIVLLLAASAFAGSTALPRGIEKIADRDNPDISLALQLFAIGPSSGKADCVAVRWGTDLEHDAFELLRAPSPEGPFAPVFRGVSSSFNDLHLPLDVPAYYRIDVLQGDRRVSSGLRSATPFAYAPAEMTARDMLSGAIAKRTAPSPKKPWGTLVDGRYYNWKFGKDEHGPTLLEESSDNGFDFSTRVLLDSSSIPCLAEGKLEAKSVVYVPEAGKALFTAHWEKKSGYQEGRLFLATSTPGGEAVFHGCERPLGIQVRDMSVCRADGACYLVAASNVEGEGANCSLRILRFADDLAAITEVTAIVHPKGYRESPHIIQVDEFAVDRSQLPVSETANRELSTANRELGTANSSGYYLFSSKAAGWYPSAGAYAFATSIQGPWSEARPIGDDSTFSSQSGYIESCGPQRMVHGYRWIRSPDSADYTLLPIAFDNGRAFYDFYPVVLENRADGFVVPVADAPDAARGAPASLRLADGTVLDAAAAVDGDYRTRVKGNDGKDWPVDLVVDLGRPHDLAAFQCSWYICKGSEGYYAYTVDASDDGSAWSTVLDRSDRDDPTVAKTYGFTYARLSERARFVRLHVLRAYLHNNPACWYTPSFPEFKVFATPVQTP